MDFLIKKIRLIYENLSSMLLASALVYAFTCIWKLKIPVIFVIIASIFTICIIRLFDKKKNRAFIFILIFIIAVFIFLMILLLQIDPINHLGKLYNWIAEFFWGSGEYNRLYAFIIAGFLTMSANIITYCIEKAYTARFLISIAVFISGITLSINKIQTPKFSVCIGLFYILNVLIEVAGRYFNKKNQGNDSKITVIYLMPICMAAAVMSVALPSNNIPIQWNSIKNAVSFISNHIDIIITEINLQFKGYDGGYSIESSGYSDNEGKLGGALTADNGNLLNITIFNKTKGDLYLTGSIRNQYTGKSWRYDTESKNYKADEYVMDIYEELYLFYRQGVPVDELKTLIKMKTILIEYGQIKTKTLFHPLKSYDINFGSGNRGVNISAENIFFNHLKGENTEYRIDFVDTNYNSNEFKDMIRSLNDFSYDKDDYYYDDFYRYIKDYLGYGEEIDESIKLNSVLTKRADYVKENYVDIPDELPARVKDLAVDLTKSYDNDYDKLKALEAYLNTYKYTISPSDVPEGEDFVDNFLFEQKEGYCTYFASSMAVMGRCIGIPTRYVEGAMLDYNNPLPNSIYAVTNDTAHAWVEAYIEGFGWLPFEPTSGYSIGRYAVWETTPTSKPYSDKTEYYTPSDLSEYTQEPPVQAKAEKVNYSKLIYIILMTVSIILIALFLFILYYFILRLKYESKLKKMSNNQKMYQAFSEMIYSLKQFGYEFKPQDTILVFANRVGKRFVFDDITFLSAAKIFMRIRYAGTVVSEEEYMYIISLKNIIDDELRIKIGKLKMFFHKFVYYNLLV